MRDIRGGSYKGRRLHILPKCHKRKRGERNLLCSKWFKKHEDVKHSKILTCINVIGMENIGKITFNIYTCGWERKVNKKVALCEVTHEQHRVPE